MKMTEAERKRQLGFKRAEAASSAAEGRTPRTYDGEDESVGEVSVERQLHHVPPQLQQLHGLSQTHEDVAARSRKHPGKTPNPAARAAHLLTFGISVTDGC